MSSTAWLIAAVIVLPAAWGWGVEALLRRFWPRTSAPAERSRSARDGVVDFQI